MNFVQLQNQFRDAEFRNKDQSQLLKEIFNEFKMIDLSKEEDQKFLIEVLRVLRNSCIECQQNQDVIMKMNFIDIVLKFIKISKNIEKYGHKIRVCAFQFLGNFVVGNLDTQKYFWNKAFPDFFIHYLYQKSSDKQCSELCTMILYNCLLWHNNHIDNMFSNSSGERIVLSICNMALQSDLCNWIYLCITKIFFSNPMFLPFLFSNCSDKVQLGILQLYCDSMEEENETDNIDCISSNITVLSEQFLIMFDILSESSSTDNIEFFVVLLDTLCWVTAVDGVRKQDIDSSTLLPPLIDLLKGSSDGFVNKVDELNDESHESNSLLQICQNLQFCPFKKSLIRLLGNLCYRNSKVQNQIHELGGIPLILNCCNIDDKHPFLQQWALFAIRNLCEGNTAIQKEIAKLEKLGVADSPVLKSLGLTAVENEQGKMQIEKQK